MTSSSINRRNILTILGLTTAGMATEAVADPDPTLTKPAGIPGIVIPSPEAQKRLATAIRNLADAIDRHEVIAVRMDVHSAMEWNNWLQHDITIKVEIPSEPWKVTKSG